MSQLISKPNKVGIERPTAVTRRDFLKSSALTAAAAFIPVSNAQANSNPVKDAFSERLADGWDYFQGSLGGVWDVWRADMTESTVWKRVQIPHCFNARDAVDPDQTLYEGPGWYRRKLQVRNPYENGRTLLLFEGAGQKCEVFVSLERIGQHVGGYDEFVFDITDAIAKGTPADVAATLGSYTGEFLRRYFPPHELKPFKALASGANGNHAPRRRAAK